MSRKIFTKEQQQLLQQNPYIYSVTDTRITLTKAFKEIFMTSYNTGTSPRTILEDHGFDISIIGERRIWSISQRIRTEYQKYGEFHEGYSTHKPLANQLDTTDKSVPSDSDKLKQLQHVFAEDSHRIPRIDDAHCNFSYINPIIS